MVDQSGFTVNYSYDAAGRLNVLHDGSGGVIVDYDYDLVGRLARETRGNFTVTLYDYDNAGQLHKITHRAADATIQSQFVYAYDSLGRRTSVTTLEGITTYDYDGVGRLTEVTLPTGQVITYAYDAAGNRTISSDNGVESAYTVNDLNQYVAFGSTTQTFDAAGNLVSSSSPGGSTAYRYDVEGRLMSQITPTGTWTYESSTVLLPACGARNVKRLRDHARCYSDCGFVPTNGLPEGGAEVGWNDVLPDVCGTW